MITMEQKHKLELRDAARAAYEEGYAEGCELACKLTRMLLEAGRIDDIRRMAEDKAYYEQLCTEFGLTYDE